MRHVTASVWRCQAVPSLFARGSLLLPGEVAVPGRDLDDEVLFARQVY